MRIEDVEVGMKLKCVSAKKHTNKTVEIGDIVTVEKIRVDLLGDTGFNIKEHYFLWMPDDFEPDCKKIRRLE